MKKLEIIIKPEKLEDLKALLDSEEVNGLNIVNSMGYGNQKFNLILKLCCRDLGSYRSWSFISEY